MWSTDPAEEAELKTRPICAAGKGPLELPYLDRTIRLWIVLAVFDQETYVPYERDVESAIPNCTLSPIATWKRQTNENDLACATIQCKPWTDPSRCSHQILTLSHFLRRFPTLPPGPRRQTRVRTVTRPCRVLHPRSNMAKATNVDESPSKTENAPQCPATDANPVK